MPGHRPRIELSVAVPSFEPDAPPNWEHLFATARHLDAAGVDRLFVSDHVVFGERLEEYARPEIGGTRNGVQPTGPDGHWLEPLTTLGVLAGMTSHIRLATNIIVAALRRPVILAKSAATLDVLSSGRLDLGVGVGWQREEYEAAGLSFAGRGKLLDQSLEVCQVLWREQRARYDDLGLRFGPVHAMPKPLQPGGVPIWVSGTVNPRVVQRVARFGFGWIPWGDDAVDVLAGITKMKAALEEVGRDPTGLRIVGGLRAARGPDGSIDIDQTMEAVPALVAGGVTDFRARFRPRGGSAEVLDFFRQVVGAFHAVAGRTDHVGARGDRLTMSGTRPETGEGIAPGLRATTSSGDSRR